MGMRAVQRREAGEGSTLECFVRAGDLQQAQARRRKEDNGSNRTVRTDEEKLRNETANSTAKKKNSGRSLCVLASAGRDTTASMSSIPIDSVHHIEVRRSASTAAL